MFGHATARWHSPSPHVLGARKEEPTESMARFNEMAAGTNRGPSHPTGHAAGTTRCTPGHNQKASAARVAGTGCGGDDDGRSRVQWDCEWSRTKLNH